MEIYNQVQKIFLKNSSNINYKAFTLVELIVVITILAILGTIAFISFGNYTTSARDGTRISDIKNMGFTLSNYYSKVGSYPIPSNSTGIVYSGGILFYHGSFGASVIQNIRELAKTPTDPLFGVEYNYSISSQKNVYQLGYIQEGNNLTYKYINKANAADSFREVLGKTSGNYNGLLVGGSTGGIVYVFSIPLIILTDVISNDITALTDKFVYDDELNIPSNYKGVGLPEVGNFTFEPKLVYSGTALPNSPTLLKPLIVNVQSALHNTDHPTTLFSNKDYQYILELDSDNPDELYNFGAKYINKDLGGRFELKYAKNCRAILGSNEDQGDGNYTISPDGLKKLTVYCDMTTDGGGWTRVRKRQKGLGYTEGSDLNKTRSLDGTELMTQYTRYGTIREFTGGIWQDLDVSGKRYGLYYKRFKTRQGDFFNNENKDCGEHTTIVDLISHVKGGTRGDCGRNCPRVGGNPAGACDASLEYTDIQVDDLGSINILPVLANDKKDDLFIKDPCIINGGHHTGDRNISWVSNGSIQHRNDSSTSLTSLGGADQGRCAGISRNYTSIQTSYNNEVSPTGFWHTRFDGATIDSRYNQGYQTNEVYIR